jgi:hypothetical protein
MLFEMKGLCLPEGKVLAVNQTTGEQEHCNMLQRSSRRSEGAVDEQNNIPMIKMTSTNTSK